MRKDTDLHSVRVGRGLIDMISKRYEEFQTKISDIEVENGSKSLMRSVRSFLCDLPERPLTLWQFNGKWKRMLRHDIKT